MSTPHTEGNGKRVAKPRATTAANPKPAASVATLSITADERQRMIREAAYFRAQERGFAPGDTMADWLAAEALVDSLISSSGSK